MKIKKSQQNAVSQQVTQGQQDAVSLFEKIAGLLAAKLPKKTQPFFISLLLGVLLAIARRRTVTQWIKAAQICDNYRQVFYHIPNIGCNGGKLFDATREIIIEQLKPVIDMKAMVEDEEGWQYVECRLYGQVVTKKVKCFVATSKLTRGKPIKASSKFKVQSAECKV